MSSPSAPHLSASLQTGIQEPIEFNSCFRHALRTMETTKQNLFITGKAGTGKSTLLKYFRDHTQKRFVLLAPTGVAAVNINGQTIHSFFGFKPSVTVDHVKTHGRAITKSKKKLFQNLDVIIIDEISMVRADLFDCMDAFLRFHGPQPGEPFGGVQVIVFGDLYQLPPVIRQDDLATFHTHYKSPHFFQAHCFCELDMTMIELEHIYRQKDPVFIRLLNQIRLGNITQTDLDEINYACFTPEDSQSQDSSKTLAITLTGTNHSADQINEAHLSNLEGDNSVFEGEITGQFREDSLPSPELLSLKPGAQIMMTNNDPKQRWINGTMGKVLRIGQTDSYENYIRVELETGKRVSVLEATWDMTKFVLENEKLTAKTVGSYKQFPLKLAWAITIHKSQGKTFQNVIIDLGAKAFAAGQTYVALSRCRSLEGTTLTKPVTNAHILKDSHVLSFLVSQKLRQAEKEFPINERLFQIADAIEEALDVEIHYLRLNGDESRRHIEPQNLTQVEHDQITKDVLKAYCYKAQKQITFSVYQILSIKNFRN